MFSSLKGLRSRQICDWQSLRLFCKKNHKKRLMILQGHFRSTQLFPASSYSCLEIHICWKVPCKKKKISKDISRLTRHNYYFWFIMQWASRLVCLVTCIKVKNKNIQTQRPKAELLMHKQRYNFTSLTIHKSRLKDNKQNQKNWNSLKNCYSQWVVKKTENHR